MQRVSLRVITCLEGRSERTRGLAREAGIADVPSYGDLVQEADLLLSIMVPAEAKNAAGKVAQAVMETGAELVYADCNAIAPQTVCQIANILTATGARFVDASIVGGPPRGESSPRLYASGPDTSAFEALAGYGLRVVVIGEEVGLASALKMCYGALTKGSSALYIELLTAARALGVDEALAQLDQLAAAGVDLAAVTQKLQDDGVAAARGGSGLDARIEARLAEVRDRGLEGAQQRMVEAAEAEPEAAGVPAHAGEGAGQVPAGGLHLFKIGPLPCHDEMQLRVLGCQVAQGFHQ